MTELKISMEEARNYLVHYHHLDGTRKHQGIEGVMQCFHQIKSIQYDPLNVVGRNPDLVLHARVEGYQPDMLETLLYQEHQLIDGFDKEMCIYPITEFPNFKRVREATGERTKLTLSYRGQLDALNVLDEVREHIGRVGAISTKDISIGEHYGNSDNRWGHKKLSSAALDYLYSIGELSVVNKKGVQKYFDFTEQVVPKEILSQKAIESEEEFLEWYITRRIQSVGLLWNRQGGGWLGHYLSDQKLRTRVLDSLCEKEVLCQVAIDGLNKQFYIAKEEVGYLNFKVDSNHVRFLAPLDNMIWDREMIHNLFDFEYRWEVYTPVVKRKYGYYVLPVLCGNRFIARFEPEKATKGQPFAIKNWWWEPEVEMTEALVDAIKGEIQNFASYLSVPYDDQVMNVILNSR